MNAFLSKIIKTSLITSVLGAFCIFCGLTKAFAQPDVSTKNLFKQVEIIIFSKIQPTALLSEQWEMPTKVPNVNDVTELVPFDDASELDSSPQVLPSTYWKINKISNRLSRSGYTIILHTAWVQNFSQPLKYPIHLFSPQQPSLHPTTVMNGTIDITLNRYFNIAIDLLFGEPIDRLTSIISPEELEKNFHNIANGIAYFHFTQSRRMKSAELNYIDHPLYGILIKITPFPNSASR